MILVPRAVLVASIALAAAWVPSEAGTQTMAKAPASRPAIGCPSLANLRILLRQAGDDANAVAARLADAKADHLGCTVLGRDMVSAIADHATLNGRAYDCVQIEGTSVCHWTLAGTVAPVDPPRSARKPPSAPEKPRR